MKLYVDVALMPQMAREWRKPVCIVVDVLRASSSVVWLLESRARTVFPVEDLETARRKAAQQGCLLAGERGGMPPPGFNFGNRPTEFRRINLNDQDVVFSTSNGTAAIASLKNAQTILMGCMNNATACCKRAFEEARRSDAMIGVVCAGQDGRFALDDGVCAGFLVDTLARVIGPGCRFSDAALAMRKLSSAFDGPETAFLQSRSGKIIKELGHYEDLVLCSRKDLSDVVPVLTAEGCFRS